MAQHCYPDDYQSWLFAALDLNPGDEIDDGFIEPLYALNRQWVQTDQVMDYDGKHAAMRAYTCYYMTINMPKLWFVLDRNPALVDELLNREFVQATELGCGPGTFLWAFLFYVQARHPDKLPRIRRLRGVDRSETAIACARRFGDVLRRQDAYAHIDLEFNVGDWQSQVAAPDDFLIFGNVLNESEAPVLSDVAAAAVLIVEPGTRRGFHPLLPVRDRLVEDGWHVHFPCPRASAPCPMAADNWCHFAINRFELPFIQRMSNRAKRLNPRHNFSAFLFSKTPHAEAGNWRVLSKLRKAHRSGIRWLCDGEHLVEAVLNRRKRSDRNRPFLDADWGDCLHMRLNGDRHFRQSGRLGADDDVSPR